jgi:hypothetical protein
MTGVAQAISISMRLRKVVGLSNDMRGYATNRKLMREIGEWLV